MDCYNAQILNKTFANRIVAFSIAEDGAMGEPGALLILTEEKKLYKTNLLSDKSAGAVVDSFGFVRYALNHPRTSCQAPGGWAYIYLGAGNHLFVLDWLKILFDKKVDRNTPESCLYASWTDVITEILDELASKRQFDDRDKCSDIRVVPHGKQEQVGGDNKIRKLLTVSRDREDARKEKIVAIGINPSNAREGRSDNTVTRLCRLLDCYGFNNVTMLNLFESVSSKQNGINESTEADFNTKRELLERADIILLIWGIEGHRASKLKAMPVLMDYAMKLYCIKNQNGSLPAHPSRLLYNDEEVKIIPVSSAEEFSSCGLHNNECRMQNAECRMMN